MSVITQEQYDELLNKVKLLQDEIAQYKVHKEWYDSQHTLTLNSGEFQTERIEFEANYSNWKYTKESQMAANDVLFIDVYEDSGDTAATAISLGQMKQLRDYLTHKIEYLEAE